LKDVWRDCCASPDIPLFDAEQRTAEKREILAVQINIPAAAEHPLPA
jgi:hypothetical protein